MQEPLCFVIMPFGDSRTDSKFVSQMIYEYVILPAFTKAVRGYPKKAGRSQPRACRIDKEFVSGPLKEDIIEKLKNAEIVVADISGNNGNVLFELGFRYAQGKPFIC